MEQMMSEQKRYFIFNIMLFYDLNLFARNGRCVKIGDPELCKENIG